MKFAGGSEGGEIKAKTRYGEIKIEFQDITSLVFGKEIGNITLELQDNSKYSGALLQDEIILKIQESIIKIPVREISRVEIGKEEDSVTTLKSTLKGKIEQPEFEIDTTLGRIKIKKEFIRVISKK